MYLVPFYLTISLIKLQAQALSTANLIFSENKDATLLNSIKAYSNSGQYDMLLESLDQFKEYSDQVLEVFSNLIFIQYLL